MGVTRQRRELAQALAVAGVVFEVEDGLQVLDHLPEAVVPPAFIVAPGEPYITAGNTFDPAGMVAHLEVHAVAGAGDNETVIDQLDGLVEAALLATDWDVDGVSRPYLAAVNGAGYLTARIRLSTSYSLTEGN